MQSLSVLINLLITLVYLACGFILTKTNKAKPEHAKSVSAILVYVCGPCMIISSFLNMEYSRENLIKSVEFFFVTLVFQISVFVLLFFIFRKKYVLSKYRILTAGTIFGNVGFFGLPLVTGLFPSEPIVACYSTMFVTSMNLLIFTVGEYLITFDKKYISLKSALVNPTTIAFLVGFPLYVLGVRLPQVVLSPISVLGKSTTPLCMFVLGMRLSSMELKSVFSNPFAYFVCLFKLVLFPLLGYLLVAFLPFFDQTFKICMAVLCACPSAAIILTLSELHETEQKLAANTVLMATVFCSVTLPLILLIIV